MDLTMIAVKKRGRAPWLWLLLGLVLGGGICGAVFALSRSNDADGSGPQGSRAYELNTVLDNGSGNRNVTFNGLTRMAEILMGRATNLQIIYAYNGFSNAEKSSMRSQQHLQMFASPYEDVDLHQTLQALYTGHIRARV
eukprot:TRINITY_DN7780_c0_g1_i2.p1 TRINITY_DN7780_c0_g1~~TRINITY_DN7780_c0_g1_i2.p1  ORF type:complete len:139 (+),score=10.38 TRINITY_DN7780_c0_g1_i2:366-782(+)